MTTYTATFEETKFLPVRQYDVGTLDSLMHIIRVEKRTADGTPHKTTLFIADYSDYIGEIK